MADAIKTVSDMMRALQQEIDDIKTGALDESKGRIVKGFRSLQLKTAELQIQYNRSTRGIKTPSPELRLIATNSDKEQ